jgi:predicted PurR-regulated permease PerM
VTESKSTSVLLPPRSELLLIGLLLLLWGMFLLRKLLLLLLLACLVAAALYPAVQWLNNKHIPRKLSILLCYSLIVLLMIGIGFLLSDIIVEQGQALVVSLPAFVDNVVERINLLPIVGADEQWSAAISNNTRMIIVQALDFLQRAFNYLIVIFQGFFGIITVLVFSCLPIQITFSGLPFNWYRLLNEIKLKSF